MSSGNVFVDVARLWAPDNLKRVAAGAAACAAIAAIAETADLRGWTHFGTVFVPPLIVALALGMALLPLSAHRVLSPGIEFSGRTLLRVGVALYGARLTVVNLIEGGPLPVVVALAAVAGTIVFGALAARAFGLSRDFGLLTGCATGVCGAAAAMATSAVLPKHDNSGRDLVFTVMGVNFISTIAMVVYPALEQFLGFSPLEMGAFLGGSIHDVAQVAGAGQTLGPAVLTDAILTKLLRVAMLLPAVVGIAWWLARTGEKSRDARPGPPVFLFGFLALAALNSMGLVSAAAKSALTELSSFLIILAIGALGMRTSLLALARIGAAPVLLLVTETMFVGGLVTAVIHALRAVGG